MKKCSKCKVIKKVELFSKDKNRPDGRYIYCKECVKKISQKRYAINKDKISKQNKKWKEENREYYLSQQRDYNKRRNRTVDGKFYQYIKGAAERGYSFEISIDEFSLLWQKPCYYCNSPIETIGIDRINNNIGYTKGNIVSCCKICNRAKDTLKQDEYIEHCKRVAGNF